MRAGERFPVSMEPGPEAFERRGFVREGGCCAGLRDRSGDKLTAYCLTPPAQAPHCPEQFVLDMSFSSAPYGGRVLTQEMKVLIAIAGEASARKNDGKLQYGGETLHALFRHVHMDPDQEYAKTLHHNFDKHFFPNVKVVSPLEHRSAFSLLTTIPLQVKTLGPIAKAGFPRTVIYMLKLFEHFEDLDRFFTNTPQFQNIVDQRCGINFSFAALKREPIPRVVDACTKRTS